MFHHLRMHNSPKHLTKSWQYYDWSKITFVQHAIFFMINCDLSPLPYVWDLRLQNYNILTKSLKGLAIVCDDSFNTRIEEYHRIPVLYSLLRYRVHL